MNIFIQSLVLNREVSLDIYDIVVLLAGERGFEPPLYGPEPHVLPLDDSPPDNEH